MTPEQLEQFRILTKPQMEMLLKDTVPIILKNPSPEETVKAKRDFISANKHKFDEMAKHSALNKDETDKIGAVILSDLFDMLVVKSQAAMN